MTDVDREIDKLREQWDQNAVTAGHIADMLNSPGWQVLDAVIRTQVFTTRAQLITSAPQSQDDLVKMATETKAAQMWQFFRALPKALIDERVEENRDLTQKIAALEKFGETPPMMDEFNEHSFS